MRYTKKVSKCGDKEGYYRDNQRISKHEYDYMKSHIGDTSTKLYDLPLEMKEQILFQTGDIQSVLNLCKTDRDFSELCRNKQVQKHINNLKIKDLIKGGKSLEDILIDAVENGHTEIVKLLLIEKDKGVDPTIMNNWITDLAIENGYADILKLLLNWIGQNGEKINLTDNINIDFSFQDAASNGHVDVIKLLLKWTGPNGERIDPSANDNRSILSAYLYEKTEIVKLLFKDPRVRNSLSPEELQKYEEYIKKH